MIDLPAAFPHQKPRLTLQVGAPSVHSHMPDVLCVQGYVQEQFSITRGKGMMCMIFML